MGLRRIRICWVPPLPPPLPGCYVSVWHWAQLISVVSRILIFTDSEIFRFELYTVVYRVAGMIASIYVGKKPHVYRVIILKQTAGHRILLHLLFLRFLRYLSLVYLASKKNPCYFCDFCDIWGHFGALLGFFFFQVLILVRCVFFAIFAIFVVMGVFSLQEKSLLLLRYLRYL